MNFRRRSCLFRLLFCCVLGCVLLASPAMAVRSRPAPQGAPPAPPAAPLIPPQDWAAQQSALCTAAVQAAEQRYHLPPGLLGTIAKVESGRPISGMADIRAWPWTIDANGTGYYLESKPAAVAWVTQALARGVPFIDVGCMQVDLQMHPHAFASLDAAFDPATNADYAARYLISLQQEAGGNMNVAVGLYHSHTPELAAAYRDRVAAVGAGIVSGVGGPMPLYMRAIRQGTLRMALAGGGVLVLHINRQPRARPGPRLSACQVARILGPYEPSRVRGCAAPPTVLSRQSPATGE